MTAASQNLARLLAVQHRFIALEPRADAAETVLERFLAAGEGRVAATPPARSNPRSTLMLALRGSRRAGETRENRPSVRRRLD